MNVLILTPDAVGSTLLQRLITIYMQFHEFDQPVINLHELTNGLEKFYSPDFNRELLCKPRDGKSWGYYQTLQEIIKLLSSVDHYKTARLAEYHIQARQDQISSQVPFYRYLDDNFFVISCRRSNLFEHALSWGLNKITKKLNVYSAEEKINSFVDIYKNKIELDLTAFEQSLNRYKSYLIWSENNFTIGSYFDYDKHINHIENYILDLPIFAAQKQKITWKDTFDIEFQDWNLTHYYSSNIGSLAIEKSNHLLALENLYNQCIDMQQHNSPAVIEKVVQNLPVVQQQHLKKHFKNYQIAQQSISKMQELGILVSSIPIKKQTFVEKKFMIKNFDQCLHIFNKWAELNSDVASQILPDTVEEMINKDLDKWKSIPNGINSKENQLYLPPTD